MITMITMPEQQLQRWLIWAFVAGFLFGSIDLWLGLIGYAILGMVRLVQKAAGQR